MDPATLTFATALGMALIHVFAGRMRFLEGIPRSRWLSAAGGVSVSYVFLHLLPELVAAETAVREAHGTVMGVEQRHVHLIALVGLATFYGLEHLASTSRRSQRGDDGSDATGAGVFWIHIASFSVYNLLIGYLLVRRREESLSSLLLYFVALGLHFLVNDFALWEHHKRRYSGLGRWILSGAVLLGWGVGVVVGIAESLVGAVMAFLAGGIILNVLKEEVPGERESRFWAFALGAGGYAVLLLSM